MFYISNKWFGEMNGREVEYKTIGYNSYKEAKCTFLLEYTQSICSNSLFSTYKKRQSLFSVSTFTLTKQML